MKNFSIGTRSKRVIVLFGITAVLFSALLIRIAYIQSSSYYAVSGSSGTRKISLSSTIGCIYDRNYEPLVNNSYENCAILLPSESTLSILKNNNSDEGFKDDINNLSEGFCVVKKNIETVPESSTSANIRLVNRYENNQLCRHIIGYLDSDLNGVCGIEKAFDSLLKNTSGKISVSYSVNAVGQVLAGDGITVNNEDYNSKAGVVLTIDSAIQSIAEKAMAQSEIKKGACVILDASSSKILAIVSVPCYDIDNLAADVNNDALPFLNRALMSYQVGSVFKPFIAAAAYENGIDINAAYTCNGNISVGTQVFNCNKKTSHGELNFISATEHSCNCYFINLGLQAGSKNVCDMCSKFGFGKKIILADTISSDAGNLPADYEITSEAQLANLCFGQGELLATPLQVAAAYAVIANAGTYNEPSLLKELLDSYKKPYAYYKSEISYKCISLQACAVISEALYENMSDGTGVNGKPSYVSSAGKTATAQTGKYYKNGAEILRTWFAGFFPYENPEYVVVIFNEEGSAAAYDCAPVFKQIADCIFTESVSETDNSEVLK